MKGELVADSMPQLFIVFKLLYEARTLLLLFLLGTEGVEGQVEEEDSSAGVRGNEEKVLDFPRGIKLSLPSSNIAFVLETMEVLVI